MLATLYQAQRSSAAAAGGPTGPALPHRGYAAGIGPRSVSRIAPTTGTKGRNIVGEITWAGAQPNGPGTAINTSQLDSLFTELDRPGTPYQTARIRIFTGRDSPAWAKALGGGPLSWQSTDGNGTVDIPKWWSTPFLDAYEDFVGRLATYLATKSTKVREVVIAGATSEYSEPCIFQFSNATNRSMALAAGYTPDLTRAAISRAIRIHHAAMGPVGISSAIAINPWQVIGSGGGMQTSLTTALDILEELRTVAGRHAVWGNNSIGAYYNAATNTIEARGGDYTTLYDYMSTQGAAKGTAVYVQTMTLAKMTGIYDPARPDPTAQYAANLGFLSVEMPAGTPDWSDDIYITQARADAINAQLEANRAAVLAKQQ